MASSKEFADFVLDQLTELGVMRVKKMFGEYGVYYGEKIVGLICDDQLFIKPTESGRVYLKDPEMGEPYPGAKPYFLITADLLEDREWACEMIRVTEKELLVSPKKKKN